MSASLLREAAALMRERAEAVHAEDYARRIVAKVGRRTPAGQHIGAMTPAVALAVADWLDQAARLHESGSTGPLDMPAALAVAAAYLGRTS